MKKMIQGWVLLSLVTATGSILANGFLGDTGPAPAQAFHTATPQLAAASTAPSSTTNTPTNTSASPASSNSEDSQMANVLAIMSAAKKQQQVKRNTQVNASSNLQAATSHTAQNFTDQENITNPSFQITTPASTTMASVASNNSQALEAEVSQLNQNVLLFQQQDNERIEDLVSKNNMLEEKIQNLDQALVILNEGLVIFS